MVPRSLVLILLLLVCLPPARSNGDLRVHVIYTGDPFPGQTPYIHMKVEPMLVVTPVQASRNHYAGISRNDIVRAIRIYMPRTYALLIESYDVVIISDSNVDSFTARQRVWFRDAVGDGGGLVMIGGYETFGGVAGNPDWGQTPVGEVLPVDTDAGAYEGGKISIIDQDHEFMSSLPWRPDLRFLERYDSNVVEIREGAVVLAHSSLESISYGGYKNPFFSTWDFGEGRTFAMTGDWTPGGGWNFLRWEYLPDFATNLMLFVAKRSLPEDLDLVHTVRSRLATIAYRRIILDSLVDFVEKFGANPGRIVEATAVLEESRREAENLYLEHDFEAALSAAEKSLELIEDAEDLADKVKNEALMWVYITEWLTVSGTALIVGFITWSVMIRRRLYREVGTTAFRGEI
jgi:uncharacterized membrane protein